eukprot:7265736-Prymnesium_polylepis.1
MRRSRPESTRASRRRRSGRGDPGASSSLTRTSCTPAAPTSRRTYGTPSTTGCASRGLLRRTGMEGNEKR